VEALSTNPTAKEVFESQSASFRKNYIVWLEALRRRQRVDEALGWIAEGKGRFWKYQNKTQ